MIIILSAEDLKDFRIRRGLSIRDVQMYCDITNELICQIETGKKNVTEYNHKEIVDGINRAYFDKCKNDGTFEAKKKAFNEVNRPKSKPKEKE